MAHILCCERDELQWDTKKMKYTKEHDRNSKPAMCVAIKCISPRGSLYQFGRHSPVVVSLLNAAHESSVPTRKLHEVYFCSSSFSSYFVHAIFYSVSLITEGVTHGYSRIL